MKKLLGTLLAATLCLCGAYGLAGCKEQFSNPGDSLGGGGTGEVAVSAEDQTGGIKEELSDRDFSELAENTSYADATFVSPTEEVVTLTKSGTYRFLGEYGGIALGADNLKLHLILNGATITSDAGVALDGSAFKKAEVVVTLIESNSITSTSEEDNAVHIKGSLSFNGSGSLAVTSRGKHAVKVTKAFTAVNCSLSLAAASHGISALSISAKNCNIYVASAGKDGLNAECEDETTSFTTEEGYIYLKDVKYTSETKGDGMQADTAILIDGGTYKITTKGEFVPDTAENRAEYGLTADDLR